MFADLLLAFPFAGKYSVLATDQHVIH